MIVSRLPYKERESDPEWTEREVRKPESLLDRIRLCFVPGHWDHHWLYGLIRIVEPSGGASGKGRA